MDRHTARPPAPAGARPHGRRHAAFSLVELLLSMLIISMLMLLGFATNRALRESAKRRQAGFEARAISQAMLAYRQDYGVWPLMAQKAPGEVSVSNIVAVLCADDDDSELAGENPRATLYLPPPPGTRMAASRRPPPSTPGGSPTRWRCAGKAATAVSR